MKIYFAGSIRGGREDAHLYFELIQYMKSYGTVLTEHIGSCTVFNDEKGSSDSDIFNQDTSWLRECDIVITECSHPSHGVGFEVAYAQSILKPVYIFHRCGTALSAMLNGNPYYKVYTYSSRDELYSLVKSALTEQSCK